MIWLELRTQDNKYKKGWNFSESIWAPTLKENGIKWPFWFLVNNVIKGDIIFHLKQHNNEMAFIGYSIASTDGYITNSLPTDEKHIWDFSNDFFRVDLENFQYLNPTIKLLDFFEKNDNVLRDYHKNKGKKYLFYAIQNNKLQCLNGAYFSEFDGIISLLIKDYEAVQKDEIIKNNVTTGVTNKELAQRVGQQMFSENVKKNYGFKCCFPHCDVEDKDFLVSGHIARWADNEDFRGNTANGLCFCLMHDKAFEKGYFTLNEDFNIIITNDEIKEHYWLNSILEHGENHEIKPRKIDPSIDALKEHWKRIGYKK
jgi:hypothetical protein